MKFSSYISCGRYCLDIVFPYPWDHTRRKEFNEYLKWCDDVIHPDCWDYFMPDTTTLRFLFKKEEDRNWFILRWS